MEESFPASFVKHCKICKHLGLLGYSLWVPGVDQCPFLVSDRPFEVLHCSERHLTGARWISPSRPRALFCRLLACDLTRAASLAQLCLHFVRMA